MITFQLLARVRQEDCPKFEASLGYVVSDPVLKKEKENLWKNSAIVPRPSQNRRRRFVCFLSGLCSVWHLRGSSLWSCPYHPSAHTHKSVLLNGCVGVRRSVKGCEGVWRGMKGCEGCEGVCGVWRSVKECEGAAGDSLPSIHDLCAFRNTTCLTFLFLSLNNKTSTSYRLLWNEVNVCDILEFIFSLTHGLTFHSWSTRGNPFIWLGGSVSAWSTLPCHTNLSLVFPFKNYFH